MRLRRSAVAAAAVAAAALWLPAQALAHANLVRSDPADGSRLASSPRQIRLEFDEDVSRALSGVVLSGARVGRVSGAAITSGSGSSLVVSVPQLRSDTYALDWRSASDDDLHSASGTLTFSVGSAALRPAPRRSSVAAPGPAAGEVVLRWIDFGAIAVLIGSLALLVVCVPHAGRRGGDGLREASRRLAALAVAAGTLAVVTGLGLLVFQVDAVSAGAGPDLGAVLTGTSYGASWIARELLIGLLLVLVLWPGVASGRASAALVLGGSLALCLALASSSHSSSARGTVSIATAALAVHLFAAALWAGGVCAVALVLLGVRHAGRDAGSTRHLLRSFSGLAVLSVSAVAITGLFSAGVDVSSPDDLLTTLYGRTLLAKTALFLAVGLVGLGNSLLINFPNRRGSWLRRGIRLEAGLIAALFLMAALLTAEAPARGPRVAPSDASESLAAPAAVTGVGKGDLLVSLSVAPNRPGVNFVTAGVFDTRRPAPAPIRAVDLSFGGANAGNWRTGRKIRAHTWQVAHELGRPGAWTIGVRVRRAGLPEQVFVARWKLAAAGVLAQSAQTEASPRTLASILTPIAAGGAVALLFAVLLLALRRVWRRLVPVSTGPTIHESRGT